MDEARLWGKSERTHLVIERDSSCFDNNNGSLLVPELTTELAPSTILDDRATRVAFNRENAAFHNHDS